MTRPLCLIHLHVLDRVFWQQLLWVFLLALDARLQWRRDDVVEDEGAINEEHEAEDLQPLERFPAQAERDYPDEERAARVDG